MATYRIFTNDRHDKNGVAMYSALKDVEAKDAVEALKHCPKNFTAPHCAVAVAIPWPPQDPEKEWLVQHVYG